MLKPALSPSYPFEPHYTEHMGKNIAVKRYLERHIEPNLPTVSAAKKPWQHVLVIPAYAESSAILDRLSNSISGPERVIVILVINRPESDTDTQCNEELREGIRQKADSKGTTTELLRLNEQCDLFVYDMEQIHGPSPSKEGVGLARKVGCDIALSCWNCGQIESDWICSSDADATLPKDYFARLNSTPENWAAATFPFKHSPAGHKALSLATAFYELRLHHYVLGLEYAGSNYAYHTLGSALAVKCGNYAQVRGFPKRAGGEDFYLLNKLAKTGTIGRLAGHCIELESRASKRVPFGTGPAVGKLLEDGELDEQPLFYHPLCFYALRAVLATIPALFGSASGDLPSLMQKHSLNKALAQASYESLVNLGLDNILQHCHRQSNSQAQFERHFHQWFDGFRTLKFIHALREMGWENQTLKNLHHNVPVLWPEPFAETSELLLEPQRLRRIIQHNWHWTTETKN
ncbi:MAG: hypothetical protein AB8B81_18900 [Halioglobus sp.]